MNTLATVVNLIGRAWAVSAEGERREIQVGDRLRGDEMLVTEPGARVDLDFGNNQLLTFLGEQQQPVAEVANAIQAELPPTAPRSAAEERQQPQAQPAAAGGEPEGHNFVQLVRINEIIEADGITPLTVARIQEVLRPLGMSLPERGFDPDEWREHRGGDERYEDAPAARHPGLSVELQGAGPDGIYNEAEIGPDGTVTAEITLDDKVREGDRLVVKDGKGNTLLDRPVTQDDLDNGISVEVPVAPGDRNVTVEATVTTPRGDKGRDQDSKPVDNLPPDEITSLPPQDSEDAEPITLDLGSYFEDNVDGKDLTYDVTGLPPGLSFDPDSGIITGTIDRSASQGGPDDDGIYKVIVTVTDKTGNQTTIDFDWSVTNPEPEARDDRQTIDEDTVATGNVLTGAGNDPGVSGSDSDPDGDPLTVTGFTVGDDPTLHPADGSPVEVRDADGKTIGEITLDENGDYSFTPAPDWNGTVPDINYTVSDGEGGEDSATLTIIVDPVNDPIEVTDIPDPTDPSDPNYPVISDPSDPTDPARGNAGDHVVFESALPGGSDQSPNQADLKVESSFTIVAPDDLHASQALTLTYTNIKGETRTLNLGKEQIEQLGSTNQTVDTQYGKLVLNGYTLNADGTISIAYEYTLERAPEVGGDHVDDRINLAVRDSDAHHPSDTDSKDLVIRIIDDAPVAVDDANSITEDDVAVSGNVIGGANASADDVADTQGADGATVTAIGSENVTANNSTLNAQGDLVIEGQFGTLTIRPDGSYTYELDNSNLDVQGLIVGDTLTDAFTYTLTDGDGDQSTATLTITVNGSNDGVTITVPDPTDPTDPNYPTVTDPADPNDPARGNVNDHVVFESGLNGGSAPDADDIRVESSFTLSALDGLDEVDAITLEVAGNSLTLSKAEVEALGITSQSISTEYGELVLNGYTLNADGSISIDYEYTLTSAPDNTGGNGDSTDDTVKITVNDRDSDNDSQDLVIRILDDAPVARDDANSIDEDEVAVTGNVIANGSTGDVADIEGADGATVTGVTTGDQTASGHVADGNVGTVISGQYGDLTLNADGSYSYELDNSNLVVQGLTDGDALTETFTYTITDADGDQSTVTLTITVNGANDGVSVEVPVNDSATTPDGNTNDHVVFESGLANGSAPEADDLKVESSFTVVALDGLATSGAVVLTFTNTNGNTQTLSLSKEQVEALGSSPVTLITEYGELVLNGYNQAADGTITIDYEYTLQRAAGVDAVDVRDVIGIKVTDRDGDQDDSQSISIKIVDDAPQAADDTNTIAEEELSVVGNVRSNDQQGADGAEVTAIASDNVSGNSATKLANGDLVIEGQYGTLTISPDGSYTYELDNTNLDVQGLHPNDTPLEEVFSYTLTDGDNDSDTAQLTISITGSNDGVTITVPDPTDPTDPNYPTVTDPADPNDPARGNVNDHVVFESGLSSGSAPDADDIRVESSFTLSALDGLDEDDAITLEVAGNSLTLSKAEVEALGTTSQSISTEYGELVLNGYTLNADGSISIDYEYTLTSAPDNTAGNGVHTDDTIKITVNDRDTDSDSQDLVIRIIDDAPVARDDTNEVSEDATAPVAGNVITSSVAGEEDDVGADGAEVTGVTTGDQTASGHVAGGNVGTVISGQYGDLTLNADGSYSYELDNSNLVVQGLTDGDTLTETFTYTITDADGDQSTATLTITVNGADDGVSVEVPDPTDPTDPAYPANPALGDISDHVVFESGLTDGSAPNVADTQVVSSFTLSALDGLAISGAITLTYTNSNGDPRTLSLSKAQVEALETTSQIVDTQYGQLELNGYTLNADGTISIDYQYTLQGAPEVSGDDTFDHIGITVTDRDGDSSAAGSSISIKIVDDAPVAADDANSITEDDASVSGNVIGGANASADDVDDLPGADGATVTAIGSENVTANNSTVNAQGDLVIEGQYGKLTIRPDGSYTYELDNSNPVVNALKDHSTPLEEVFKYTLTDGDGDSDTAELTITINGRTDGPPEVDVTDHNGADVGNNSIAEDATTPVTGEFTVTAPDGLEAVTVGGITVTEAELADLTGSPVIIPGTEGTLTLTGYDPSTGKVTYEYQQSGDNKDHSGGDNSVTDSFPITVTDKGGDTTAPSDLVILITDTAPVANPDTGSIDEDGAALTGNVITDAGTGEDEIGADATTVTGVTKGTQTGDQSDGSSVGGSGVSGDYGTLVLNSDGSYTYTLDPDNAAVNALKDNEVLTETFSYTIQDADGDWSTTTLTITINGKTDGTPSITPEDDNGAAIDGHNTVNESGLAGGSSAGDGSNSVDGSIQLSAGDGLASITIGGQSFTLAELQALSAGSPSAAIPVAGGTLVLTDFTPGPSVGGVPTSGTLEYTYTLTGERTHSAQGNDDVLLDIPLSVTDAGNATATGNLTIQVVDDVPTAVADTGAVTEGGTLTVDAANGVLDNDIDGADGWHSNGAVVGVVAGDTNTTSSSGVGGRIDGQYGYLILNADGSYEYVSTADAITADAIDVFTYTVRDGDGDLSHTTLTINVKDVSLPPIITPNDSVNESGLVGGTTAGDGSQSTTGQITLPQGLDVVPGSGSTTHGNFTIDKDGNYSYTLTGNTSGDNTSDSFTYVTIDTHGNTVTNTVTINIVDDAPVAEDDVNSIPAGSYAEVTGELINGGLAGAGKDSVGADGATITSVVNTPVDGTPAGTPVAVPTDGTNTTISGQYGVLTIEADGSYSYVRNPGTPGGVQDVFTYTLTDSDGDFDDATLTIDIGDATPTISDLNPSLNGGELTFEEKHLPGGSDEDASQLTKEGDFTINSPDGIASLVVGGVTVIADGALTSTTTVPTPAGHTLVITGYDPATGKVSYEYTLTGREDHDKTTNDTALFDNISVELTDQDGQTASDSLSVRILDDVPQANDDTNSIDEDGPAISGNVIAGDAQGGVADDQGADGARVTDVSSTSGNPVDASDPTGVLVIDGEYGTLTIRPDGSYDYELHDSAEVNALKDGKTLTEEFTYTLTDTDGDSDTAKLTITINGKTDGTPSITPEDDNGGAIDGHNTVNESGLAGGSSAGDGSNSVDGGIQLSAGDGLASITIGGQSFTLAELQALASTPSAAITVEGGILVLTGFTPGTSVGGVPTSGTLEYTYTLTGERTHSAQGNDDVLLDIPLSVTDAGNETATGKLTIQVVDDVPTAVDDVADVAAGTFELVEDGNLLDNDAQGADGARVTGIQHADDASVTSVPGTGNLVIDGEYGKLTIHSDGSYSYQRDPGTEGGVNDVFNYTITDGDGDTSSASLTISIADSAPTVDIPSAGSGSTTVYESGLPDGSDNIPDRATTSGSIEFNSADGLDTVSLGGHTLTETDQTFPTTGPAGSLTARYEYDPVIGKGTIHYSYTLEETTSGDNTSASFTVEITDQDGDAAPSGNLVINIVDDTPTAAPDQATVTEGATLTVDAANGVLENDAAGADGWHDSGNAVVGVTSNNQPSNTATTVAGELVIDGQYGTLTLNADGSYTYESRANAVTGDEQDVFTYTVRDADGDETTATLTINISDVTGTSRDTTDTVDEAGLPAGSDASSDKETTDGSLNLADGWTVDLSSVGNQSGDFGTLTINADGSYSYELTSRTENVGGVDETDTFTYTAVDQYGNTVTNTVTITIIDDKPTVTLTGNALGEVQVDETTLGDAASADFSGAFSHDFGADGDGGLVYTLEVDTAATGLLDTETGDPIVLVASPDGLTVTGHVGDDSGPAAFTISVDASGEVTLTQNRPLHHTDPNNHDDVLRLPDGSLKLAATATDGDGDTDSASVDIGGRLSFKDDGPTIGAAPTPGAVDEAYLTTGSGDGAAGLSTETSAGLDVNFGADGQGSLVFSGEQVALRNWLDASGNTDITITGTGTSELSGMRGGQEIFTVTLTVDANGQASYHFELKGAMLHRDSAQNHELTFNYEAVDGDGDRADGTFVVEVVDDNPRTELTIEVDEDKSHGPFNTSADATQDNISISTTDGGPAVPGTADGTDMNYDVGHGTVTVHEDGKVTYTPKPDYSNHGGSDEFYIKVNEDHGGSQTKVTVNVLPEADAPLLEADKALDTPEDTAVLLELKLPEIKDDGDQSPAAAGDHPERLGEITLAVQGEGGGTPPAVPELQYVPDGTGTPTALTGNGSGGYTIVIVDGAGDIDTSLHHAGLSGSDSDVNYLTRAEYESLQATPAEDRHENFDVVVSVKSYEVDDSGVPLDDSQVVGTNGAESTQTITVDVQAVTDEVALELKADPSQPDIVIATGNKSADITVNEDTAFDLTAILNPDVFKDTDGSETRYLGFDGLPVGTIVTVDGTEYTIGAPGIPTQDFGSGPVPVIVIPGTQTSLPEVSIRPPQDFSGDLENIKVILGARDSDADSPSATPQLESDEITLNLYVNPMAGDVNERSSHTIDEDNPVAFLSGIKVTDSSRDAAGGEVITQVEFSLPTDANGDWTLSKQPAAPNLATDGWSISGTDSGPYIITFNDDSGAGPVLSQDAREDVLAGFEATPPAHSSLSAKDWVIEVITVDSQEVDGSIVVSDPVPTNHEVTITVNPVAERTDSNTDGQNGNDVTINPSHVYGTHGIEDEPLDLGADVDAGFRLSNGWSNEDGKFVDDGTGNWAEDPAGGRSEDTYALLTPYTTGNDAQADASIGDALLGSIFTYSDGTDTHTLVFTGEPVAIPMQYLDSVTFQGPKDWFGVVKIEVNARTVDYDEDDGSATDPADSGQSWLTNLIIQPKADKVTLKVDANPGTVEDTAVALNIRPTTSSNRTDVDTTFDVSIAGIPEGAQVEYGGVTYVTDASLPTHDPADDTQPTGMYQAADGSYVLVIRDFDETDQPILTPPKSSNETIKLSVTADSVDTLTYIDKDGQSQTVTSRGSEQTPSLTHTLPIEVEVLGVPNEPDMVIVDGVYTEDAGDQSGGQLEVALDELITSLESGEINAGADGSETVTLRISNLPEGFELIGAGPVITGEGDNRVWVVTQKDLDDGNITIRVPQHWSGTLEFTVQPVVTENDNKAEKFFDEHNVKFTVNPVAEATLSISSNLLEDTVGELQLAPVGADSDEYISEVRIAVDDLPAGVTLYADAAGSIPLVAGGDGYYTISNPGTSGAPSVYVKGPANFSGSIDLDIEYKVTDPSTDGSLAADVSDWKTGDHTLNFVPHTDQIGMGVTGATGSDVVTDLNAGVTTKTGAGTVDVTLDISQLADSNAGGAVDTDGSEQLTHIVVSGLAPGVSVQGAIDIGGGRWLLQVNEDWDGSADLSKTLTFVIGPYASDFESGITITAYSRDQGAAGQSPAGNQERAEISWQLNYVGGTGEPVELPEVSLTPTDIAQSEDSSFQLGEVVTGGATGGQNNGDPYELTVTIRTSPDDDLTFAGLTPTLVVENGEQVVLWTATTTVGTGDDPTAVLQAVLDSITVHAPSDANRNNLDGPLALDITASVHTQGVSREVQADIEVDIAPVTDDLGIGVGSVSVDEGVDIPLNITVPSNTVDGELGGSGDASWEIENDLVYIHIPDGGLQGELTDASGTPLVEFSGTPPAGTPSGGKVYAVSPEELAGLKFVPDASLPHQTGSLDVTVLVEHRENGGDTKVSTGTGSLAIHQSNSGYEADITAEGDEHSVSADSSKAIKLQFGPDSGLVDAGETIESAFLSGLPDGFTVYYQNELGDSVLANNAGDGTWVIPVSGGQLPEGIAILPPKHWSGTLEDLKLTVRSGHTGQASSPSEVLFDLVVTPQADGLELNPTLSFGIAGDKIALNLNSHMKDPREAAGADGDEHTERTHLELSGFPDGEKVQFYTGAAGEVDLIADGRATYDGSKWVIQGLTQSELDNLQFVHGSTTGNQTIDVVAKTYEVDADGNQVGAPSASATGTMDINVDATLPTAGADLFLWEGSPIDGQGGEDTVQLRFGDNLDSGDFSQLSNIEVIDMSGVASGVNTITAISVEDVLNMTDGNNLLKLLGDAEDSVTLGTGWGTGVANGDFTVFTATHGGTEVTLEVQTTLIE